LSCNILNNLICNFCFDVIVLFIYSYFCISNVISKWYVLVSIWCCTCTQCIFFGFFLVYCIITFAWLWHVLYHCKVIIGWIKYEMKQTKFYTKNRNQNVHLLLASEIQTLSTEIHLQHICVSSTSLFSKKKV
jgi:hypothetical protein